jgi:hypothetical protein
MTGVPRSFRYWWAKLMVLLVGMVGARVAFAHPTPFSYLDLGLSPTELTGDLVVHVYDAAHELGLDPSERLLLPGAAEAEGARLASVLDARLRLSTEERVLRVEWSAPQLLGERGSLGFHFRCPLRDVPGRLRVEADLFPYDPEHRTFVNLYQTGELREQAILERRRPVFEHYTGTRQGKLLLTRRFVASGIEHIIGGADHVLFLIGLLLAGSSVKKLLAMVTAFTLSHSLTLALAVLGLLTPPSLLIEPAIALSIVYTGADNLLVRGGRDVRVWIAFFFGLIHGFGFANVLAEMGLASQALGWSLLSFNVGVEIGQLCIVAGVATVLALVRARRPRWGQAVLSGGSVLVIVAGAFWFVERLLFALGFGGSSI